VCSMAYSYVEMTIPAGSKGFYIFGGMYILHCMLQADVLNRKEGRSRNGRRLR
jgi:hypothetical protein